MLVGNNMMSSLGATHQTTGLSPAEAKADKAKKEKGKAKETSTLNDEQENENKEGQEDVYKSFVVRPNAEFNRPVVFVEMENNDKWETVMEIFIRSWKVDENMIDILGRCAIPLQKLTTLHFWNVGIDSITIVELSVALTKSPQITTLILEANPIPEEENFSVLLEGDSQLQTLLLRHNAITKIGAAKIGSALANYININTKLLNLNLNGNRIDDEGFRSILKGLRLNRTLLSLAVGNNQISDASMKYLYEVFTRFQLTHEEVVEQRKLKSKFRDTDRFKAEALRRLQSSEKRGKINRTGASRGGKDRPSSQTRNQSQDKANAKPGKKDAKNKKEPKEEIKDKGKKVKDTGKKSETAKTPKADARSPSKPGVIPKGKKGKQSGEPVTPEPQVDTINPLLETCEPTEDKELVLMGNNVLCNLNMASNVLTDQGVHVLHETLEEQTTLIESKKFKVQGTGLIRISVMNNRGIQRNGETMRLFNELMSSKDPMLKQQRPPTANEQKEPDKKETKSKK